MASLHLLALSLEVMVASPALASISVLAWIDVLGGRINGADFVLVVVLGAHREVWGVGLSSLSLQHCWFISRLLGLSIPS